LAIVKSAPFAYWLNPGGDFEKSKRAINDVNLIEK